MKTPKLSANVSRCAGDWHQSVPGHASPHPICADCLRRTIAPYDRQLYMLAPQIVEGCAYKLTAEAS